MEADRIDYKGERLEEGRSEQTKLWGERISFSIGGCMKRFMMLSTLIIVSLSRPCGVAQGTRHLANPSTVPAAFDTVATASLIAMRARAEELKIGGVAIVAYFEGETIQSWSSKMIVVGRYKDEPAVGSKGSNLLAIVYAKASEMADTHKDSGSQIRPPMTGEVGWNGGLIEKTTKGYVIAAFSGGKSEDDVDVSRAGLAKLRTGF